MVLIIINEQTGEIVGVAGVRPIKQPLSEPEKEVVLAELLPSGMRSYNIMDDFISNMIWQGLGFKAVMTVFFDSAGNLIDVLVPPQIQISTEKNNIQADGLDTAIITAITPDDTEIVFIVDETEYRRQATNGNAKLELTCDTPGQLMIEVISPTKYGRNYLVLEVTPIG